MPYSAGDTKWGEPVLGEPSGTIYWSQTVVDNIAISASYDTGDISAALVSAFDAWESVAAIDFEMVSSGGDVVVGAADLASGVAGQANYTFDGNAGLSEIFSGSIAFNTDYTWSPDGSGGADFYAVALHEIGHILGLGHVDDTSEIMNPVVYANSLGDGDIAGVQFLYGTGDGSDGSPPPLVVSEEVPSSSGGGGGAGGAIGLIAGLLALIFGLFSGGGGAAALVAAGRLPEDDSLGDEGGESHFDVSFLPSIPVEEFDPIYHHHDEDDELQEWLI